MKMFLTSAYFDWEKKNLNKNRDTSDPAHEELTATRNAVS